MRNSAPLRVIKEVIHELSLGSVRSTIELHPQSELAAILLLNCSSLRGLVAKRLEHIPNSDPPRVRIISDNPLYKPYEGSGEEVNVIGRAREM